MEANINLHLFVGFTIRAISYNIPGTVSNVFVRSSGNLEAGKTLAGWLRIGVHSTFCGIKTYAWDHRSGHLDRQIVHIGSCYFNTKDDLENLRNLMSSSGLAHAESGAGSPEDDAGLREKIIEGFKGHCRDWRG